MSIMRCDGCEHSVDTDFYVMEEIDGGNFCEACVEESLCSRCNEPNPFHLDRDGCRDPDCPEGS